MKHVPAAYRHRLAMYDYARGNCAREEFLARFIDWSAANGLTGVAVYLEDLAMFVAPVLFHGSIHLDGWRRLDQRARDRGLMLLPLLNLYGHTEQTLAHQRFAPLRDDARGTTLDHDNPRTKSLVHRVLDVVAQTFHSPFIHIGFDEVWGLGQRAEQRTGQPVNVPAVFAKHLIWVSEQVRQRGRRPMFWSDIPGVYYPELIPDLPRDLIAVDWFYRCEPEYPSMTRWTKHGFELWVAPTIGDSGSIWPDMPGGAPHAASVLEAGRQAGAAGVIFTFWEHGFVPLADRLPLLVWENELAIGRARGVRSLEPVLCQFFKPSLGARARKFVEVSVRLGALNRLLPAELRYGARNIAELRQAWYRENPLARRTMVRARAILRQTQHAARDFPKLAFAHEQFTAFVALLDPVRVDTRGLARQFKMVERGIRRNWLCERTAESYRQHGRPVLRELAVELQRWPARLSGRAPTRRPAVAYADRDAKPALPSLRFPDADARAWMDVYLWYNHRALHFLFHCQQRRPARGVEQSVDHLLTRDDLVAVCLDIHGQRRGYLWWEGNPSGTTFCQVHDQDNINQQWHPLAGRKNWGRAVKVAGGWGIEFRLSFAELPIRPPKPGQIMGLTLERRQAWSTGPIYRWGGLGRVSRDHPHCLSQLIFR